MTDTEQKRIVNGYEIKPKANLCGANLCGANLCGANLDYQIIQIGPIGSRCDYLVYKTCIDEAMTGCFRGNLNEFAAAVEKNHGDNEYGRQYRLVIQMLRSMIQRESKEATLAS